MLSAALAVLRICFPSLDLGVRHELVALVVLVGQWTLSPLAIVGLIAFGCGVVGAVQAAVTGNVVPFLTLVLVHVNASSLFAWQSACHMWTCTGFVRYAADADSR